MALCDDNFHPSCGCIFDTELQTWDCLGSGSGSSGNGSSSLAGSMPFVGSPSDFISYGQNLAESSGLMSTVISTLGIVAAVSIMKGVFFK